MTPHPMSDRLRGAAADTWRWVFLQLILLPVVIGAAVWVILDFAVWIPEGTEPDAGFADAFAISGCIVVAFTLLRSIPKTIMEAKHLSQRAGLAVIDEHAARTEQPSGGPTLTPG